MNVIMSIIKLFNLVSLTYLYMNTETYSFKNTYLSPYISEDFMLLTLIIIVLLSFLYELSKLLKLAILLITGPMAMIGVQLYRMNVYYLDQVKIGTFGNIVKRWNREEMSVYLHMQEQNNNTLKTLNKKFTAEEVSLLTEDVSSISDLNIKIVNYLLPSMSNKVNTNTYSYVNIVSSFCINNMALLLAIGGIAFCGYLYCYTQNVQNTLLVTNDAAAKLGEANIQTLDEIKILKESILQLTNCTENTDTVVSQIKTTIPTDLLEILKEHDDAMNLLFELSETFKVNPLLRETCYKAVLSSCNLDEAEFPLSMDSVKDTIKETFPGIGRTLK